MRGDFIYLSAVNNSLWLNFKVNCAQINVVAADNDYLRFRVLWESTYTNILYFFIMLPLLLEHTEHIAAKKKKSSKSGNENRIVCMEKEIYILFHDAAQRGISTQDIVVVQWWCCAAVLFANMCVGSSSETLLWDKLKKARSSGKKVTFYCARRSHE